MIPPIIGPMIVIGRIIVMMMVEVVRTIPRVPSPIATPVTAPSIVIGAIPKRDPPRAERPTPRPAGVGIRGPHIVPVPRIGPGRSYPRIIVGDIHIPVVIVEEIDIGIIGIAQRNDKLGIVEPAYAHGIFIIRVGTRKAIQVIPVVTILIDNVIFDMILGLIGSHLLEGHL